MIKIYSVAILFALLFTDCQRKDGSDANIYDDLFEKIRLKYAPDKRVALFNVTLENGILKGETNLAEAKKEIIASLGNIAFIDSLLLLTPTPGLVNVSVCNIRSEPRHASELATQALMGTQLRIYKNQDHWYFVQTPDGYLGWLDQGAFIHCTAQNISDWQSAEKVVVTKSFDFVYADFQQNIISDVVEGNILESGAQIDQYRQVKLPDGRRGFVETTSLVSYDHFIKLKEPLLENILQTAHQMMGRPYLWGGTSGKGMDCSGFTKTVFYLNALELPRDASQQVQVGLEVETDSTLKNLTQGDFLFFGNKRTATHKEKITHVAIYLGDGKIIHASDRVQIESLKRGDPDFTEKRLTTLVCAKRMLANIGENGIKKLADHPAYQVHALEVL